MSKQKKQIFKLKPDWMFKKPIDFEFNKYTLLDYLQKCENNFNNLQIYPDFVELSLHLANIQSLGKENKLLMTKKNFESCDDEILLKELIPKKPRQLTDDESNELDKTIRYSGNKLFDAFNMAKSIWSMAYDNMDLSLKRNKNNLVSGRGYVYYYRKSINQIYIWEYEIKKPEGENFTSKTYMNLIFQSEPTSDTLISILENFSSWNKEEFYRDLPIFDMRCSNDFPMEETFVPIMKRKIMAYVFQIVNLEKINNFDTEL